MRLGRLIYLRLAIMQDAANRRDVPEGGMATAGEEDQGRSSHPVAQTVLEER
jgi:hypothetical protein